jgi:hypothetical protein
MSIGAIISKISTATSATIIRPRNCNGAGRCEYDPGGNARRELKGQIALRSNVANAGPAARGRLSAAVRT